MRVRKLLIVVILLMIFSFCNLIDDNKVLGTDIDIENESVYDTLVSANSLVDFWQIMMAEENKEFVLAFTADEIFDLISVVNSLYNKIESLTDDDTEYRDLLIETLESLPAAECYDCGLSNEHASDCPRAAIGVLKSGTQGAVSITSNTTWNLDGNITLTGTVTVKSGYTLKIYNDSATRTIKRGSNFTGDMFYVEKGATLHINGTGVGGGCYGNWDAAIVVDGNSSYTATGQIIDCSGRISLRDTVICNNKGWNAIWLGSSGNGPTVDQHHKTTIEITRTKIENCTVENSAGIKINGDTPSTYTVEIWDTLFYKCTAVDGSAMYLAGAGQAEVRLITSVIDDCDQYTGEDTQYGGCIRTNGNGRYKLIMEDSIVRNCDSWRFGGGVYWNAAGDGSKLEIIDCQFLNNSATEMGGGMFLEGRDMTVGASSGTVSEPLTTGMPDDLTGTLIKNNYARYGGGICYKCYSNSADIQVYETTANFSENVIFEDNTGVYGAAIAYNLHDTPNYPNGAKFTFNIDGANFINNVGTGYGGAMYITKCRTDYVLTVNYNSGIISNNKAANGGAIAICTDTGVTVGGVFNMEGGVLSNNTATTNGGAVYLEKGDFNMSGGTVINNDATLGGAIYVTGGNFSMTDGLFTENHVSGNGGAVYINSGKYMMSGGIVDKNEAENGGSAYVTGGTYTLSGGTLSNNKAFKDGGAVFVNQGNFEMTGGIVSNNQATNYGGGIYASSNTTDLIMTITSGSIIGNIANKNGGGIGVNIESGLEGIVTVGLEECKGIDNNHSHPVIRDNTANENGGGFWFNGDGMTMNMYCGTILNNIALLEEGSANIYQTGGMTTIHAGDVGTGVIVIGGEYEYIPNVAEKVYITYNSNIPNNVETKVAQLTVGVDIFLPEKLYTREGYSLVGWSYNQNPISDDEIISTGEIYTVTDKDVTVYAVWRVFGVGKIEIPIIKAGKYYNEITGDSNILITSNSSFTALMSVKDMDSSLYSDRKISFDKTLPNGTTILLIDISNNEARKVYSYKILDDITSEIYLNNFLRIGTNEYFVNTLGTILVNETLLFVVELPQNSSILGPTQMTLTRKAIDEKKTATIEQKLSFTTTEKRNFEFGCEIIDNDLDENYTINDNIKFSFSNTNPNGIDTRYNGKNLSLVLTGNIPEDTKVIVGNTTYSQDADSKFVIPFGNVFENIEKEIKIESETVLENEYDLNLVAELYSVDDYDKPHLFEKIAKIENINISYIPKPAIDISFNGRVKYADEMGDTITLDYETLNISDNYDVTISVQKKDDLGRYETNSSLVQSVSGGTDLGEGKYKLDLSDSGKIKITFLDNLILENGTYRVYLEVKEDDKDILKVPYNFIILEKEEA